MSARLLASQMILMLNSPWRRLPRPSSPQAVLQKWSSKSGPFNHPVTINVRIQDWCCIVVLHFVAVSFAGAHSLSLELGVVVQRHGSWARCQGRLNTHHPSFPLWGRARW